MSKRAMSDHTSLPWSIDDDGDTIFIWADAVKDYVAVVKEFGWSAPMHANAAFIVRAVNSHDALVSVLTDARNALASLPMESLGYASDPMGEQIHWPIRDELLHRINEALGGPAT